MGKITVKHYLNTNLKPYMVGEDKYYKVYFLLRYQNKNTKIRSLVSEDEYTEQEFASILNNDNDIINIRIKNEAKYAERVIALIEESGVTFNMGVFNTFWDYCTKPVIPKLIAGANIFKTLYRSPIFGKYIVDNLEIYESVISKIQEFCIDNDLLIIDNIFDLQLFDERLLLQLNSLYKDGITVWYATDTGKKEKIATMSGELIQTIYEYSQRTFSVIDVIFYLIEDRFGTENPQQSDMKAMYGKFLTAINFRLNI